MAHAAKWRIIVDIYEPAGAAGWSYPVVTHIFNGMTQAEAEGYYTAHLDTDEFFRDCIEKGAFRGEFRCLTESRIERRSFWGGWKPA